MWLGNVSELRELGHPRQRDVRKCNHRYKFRASITSVYGSTVRVYHSISVIPHSPRPMMGLTAWDGDDADVATGHEVSDS
jgi:hypothetical protein